jgi:hypothetical protein
MNLHCNFSSFVIKQSSFSTVLYVFLYTDFVLFCLEINCVVRQCVSFDLIKFLFF